MPSYEDYPKPKADKHASRSASPSGRAAGGNKDTAGQVMGKTKTGDGTYGGGGKGKM